MSSINGTNDAIRGCAPASPMPYPHTSNAVKSSVPRGTTAKEAIAHNTSSHGTASVEASFDNGGEIHNPHRTLPGPKFKRSKNKQPVLEQPLGANMPSAKSKRPARDQSPSVSNSRPSKRHCPHKLGEEKISSGVEDNTAGKCNEVLDTEPDPDLREEQEDSDGGAGVQHVSGADGAEQDPNAADVNATDSEATDIPDDKSVTPDEEDLIRKDPELKYATLEVRAELRSDIIEMLLDAIHNRDSLNRADFEYGITSIFEEWVDREETAFSATQRTLGRKRGEIKYDPEFDGEDFDEEYDEDEDEGEDDAENDGSGSEEGGGSSDGSRDELSL